MNQQAEGVIKFHLKHEEGPAPSMEETSGLRAWFRILHRLDLLGRDPQRYLGYAYGNISQRDGDGFLISCTQTSGREQLTPQNFSRVTDFDIQANWLRSHGPCPPSSEAMTHGAVYGARPEVGAVFHVHSPDIWQQAGKLGLPKTDSSIEYGTPEMAQAVGELLDREAPRIFSMGGHEDGIVAWGESAEEAGSALLRVFARSLA
jgi:ribulose-5-phosphate 4-epimerase/fuculose-1-phosphate aldolase